MNERKAKCGCYVEQREDGAWVVTANSFLCRAHRNGEAVSERFAPVAVSAGSAAGNPVKDQP